MFFAPDVVVGQAGLFELNFDLLCHNIEFVDPFMDSVFVESAWCLVESGHPDVFRAWQDVWVATWPDGCIVKLIDSADGKEGALRHIDSNNIGISMAIRFPCACFPGFTCLVTMWSCFWVTTLVIK